MPGFVVYSPYDGAPVPAANEQVRDELVNVFGHHLEPPALDDEAAEQDQAVEQEQSVANATPAEGQALQEHDEEAGDSDDHEPVRADLLRLQADQDR